MAKVELKQPVVQEISEQIKDAQSIVLVDYRGLTVDEDTQLRKQLREAGVAYKVGTFYDADGIKVIASIPSREELLSKFLGSIQSPITNFARVLNQIAEQGGEPAAAEEAAPAAESN